MKALAKALKKMLNAMQMKTVPQVLTVEQQLIGHLNLDAQLKKVNMKHAQQTLNAETIYIVGMHPRLIDRIIRQNVFLYIVKVMVLCLVGIRQVAKTTLET